MEVSCSDLEQEFQQSISRLQDQREARFAEVKAQKDSSLEAKIAKRRLADHNDHKEILVISRQWASQFALHVRSRLPRELRDQIYDNLISPHLWIQIPTLWVKRPTFRTEHRHKVMVDALSLGRHFYFKPEYFGHLAIEIAERFLKHCTLELRDADLIHTILALEVADLGSAPRNTISKVVMDIIPREKLSIMSRLPDRKDVALEAAIQSLFDARSNSIFQLDLVVNSGIFTFIVNQLKLIIPTMYATKKRNFRINVRSPLEEQPRRRGMWLVHDFTSLFDGTQEECHLRLDKAIKVADLAETVTLDHPGRFLLQLPSPKWYHAIPVCCH
ncbi:uncharacterized protein BDR25DRAFT_40081 [Lindgomyces ingoldianus]|uniref:Uncharacterized protein n=1 Tax=Lindgomyces ingoldianus TaxID=673940 RepID=A0ACB6QS77_9PLEO|nr:uncharacterized protein BDR25DRAFT_40081 [Lindgomyces ingoldianus]KAF2469843.1 hypothetical protein BDR25DRAFT_40081 [Lindgomyces ingoldianus]